MQESFEKRIRENLTTLVDSTSNADDVLAFLREKGVFSDEEHDAIVSTWNFEWK